MNPRGSTPGEQLDPKRVTLARRRVGRFERVLKPIPAYDFPYRGPGGDNNDVNDNVDD